jgi:hypothetical protein
VTSHRDNLLHTANLASADYRLARKQLDDAQAMQRLGMNVALMDAVSREHVSYHAWRRAMTALASS